MINIFFLKSVKIPAWFSVLLNSAACSGVFLGLFTTSKFAFSLLTGRGGAGAGQSRVPAAVRGVDGSPEAQQEIDQLSVSTLRRAVFLQTFLSSIFLFFPEVSRTFGLSVFPLMVAQCSGMDPSVSLAPALPC